ncbi:B box and SPRY domain-containing protein isoform X5 [Heterocephalus glaber]|uniref:B box and SPRY domain-containing protein isoform X5 n=1 Tax=Heterocephalus glaber TaxID=10181 RepID=A0AAX6PDK7_HETGA|nr:B box and SPRY domain-containing protein isoform X5 [Heterocephalus glaber]
MAAEGSGLQRELGPGPKPDALCPEHGQGLGWFCGSERRPVCAACVGPGGRCRGHRVRRAKEHAEELRNKIVDQCERLQLQSAGITKYVAEVLSGKNQRAVQKEQEIFERTEEAEGILDPQESEKLNFNEKCTWSPLLTQLWATAVLGSLSGTEDVRIDERTVSPFLQLSDDRRTLTFSAKKSKACADGPERFDHWPNALAAASFQTGLHAWMVNVQNSCAYKVGVASGQLPRKGSGSDCRLGHNTFSWVFSRYDQEFRFLHNGQHQPLGLLRSPAQLGVLLDLEARELLFYEPASGTVLYTYHTAFPTPLFPVFAVADQTISIIH